MAWVDGRYYRRSIREGDRVRTEYWGAGAFAELGEAVAAHERAEREARIECDRKHRAECRAEATRGGFIRELVALCLEAAGYVRYRRGPWKRRRQRPMKSITGQVDRGTIAAAIAEAQAGQPGALGRLRALAAADPELVARQACGHVAELARAELVASVAGGRAMEVGLEAHVGQVVAELAGPGPASAARRLCIEAAAFAYLEHWVLSLGAGKDLGPAFDRRRDGAQRRFLRSLKTLAQITALERPSSPAVAVQVGVAVGGSVR